jgi:hypothetical protein
MVLTLSVHWHIQISDFTICSKDFAKVIFVYILGKLLNHNLESLAISNQVSVKLTFVLRIGLGDLPRLTLRLSLLYLPFLRGGVRLADRGETVRRGLEGERESFR